VVARTVLRSTLRTHPSLDFSGASYNAAATTNLNGLATGQGIRLGTVPNVRSLGSPTPNAGQRMPSAHRLKAFTKAKHCATISKFLQFGSSILARPGCTEQQIKAEADSFPFVQITPGLGSIPKVLEGLLWVRAKLEPKGREAFSSKSLLVHSIHGAKESSYDFVDALGLTSDLPV
jgi:hypothetical protein